MLGQRNRVKPAMLNFIRPRYLLTLILFLLGLLIIIVNISNYQQQANQKILSPGSSKKERTSLSIQEIKAKFSNPVNHDSNYEVIAKNNLFSPEREAWQPPKDEESEQEKQKKARNRRRRISHNGVRLYGSTIFSDQKMALMYFQPFSDKQKYRMVHEGQTIRDSGDRGEHVFFNIKTINAQKVVLEDPQGESFEVGLYDHRRKAQSSSPQARSRIIIGGQENNIMERQTEESPDSSEKTKSETRASKEASKETPNKEEQKSSDQDQRKTSQDKDKEKEKGKNPFKALLEKMQGSKKTRSDSTEEKERQVKEGKMRKVETPFGTIYRPAK